MATKKTSPAHCLTCGSEIVETINDSNFRQGECGPCEYQRYMACGDLIDACREKWCWQCRYDTAKPLRVPVNIQTVAALTGHRPLH